MKFKSVLKKKASPAKNDVSEMTKTKVNQPSAPVTRQQSLRQEQNGGGTPALPAKQDGGCSETATPQQQVEPKKFVIARLRIQEIRKSLHCVEDRNSPHDLENDSLPQVNVNRSSQPPHDNVSPKDDELHDGTSIPPSDKETEHLSTSKPCEEVQSVSSADDHCALSSPHTTSSTCADGAEGTSFEGKPEKETTHTKTERRHVPTTLVDDDAVPWYMRDPVCIENPDDAPPFLQKTKPPSVLLGAFMICCGYPNKDLRQQEVIVPLRATTATSDPSLA